MATQDKFNILFNQINLIKNEKMNLLYNEIYKKEDDLKNVINEKDIIIQEMNETILKQDNIIKKHKNEIESIKKKIEEIIKNIDENSKQMKKDIDYNISRERDKLKMMIDEINYNLTKKMDNNIIEEELKELLHLNEAARYQLVIDHEFKNDPQKLKYKLDISKTNDNFGINDIFEIFISFKDQLTYIISPNMNNYNLDIYDLHKIIKVSSLSGHKNRVSTIKYFIEKYKYKEYLISGDFNQIVIIWDITLNYNIKYKIDTKYENFSIYSCLLMLWNNYYDTINNKYNENYIITST